MSPAVIGMVLIFLAIGAALGWYGQKTYAAHGDVKVAKTRLSGGRRTRWRSALLVVAIGIAIVITFKDVLRPH
jgi:hypothetical protein